MPDIYIISDPHFGHENILKFERNEFKSIEEHDEFLIASINKRVKPSDILYILGDVGNVHKVRFLNGRKILIKGNHDKTNNDEYLAYFSEVHENPIYLAKRIILSHIPVPTTPGVLNVHGHLHGSILDSDNHFNVSAMLVNYTPVTLDIVNLRLQKLQKDRTHFLDEWYANMYVFTQKRTDVVYDEFGKIKLEESRELNHKLKTDYLGYVIDCLVTEEK